MGDLDAWQGHMTKTCGRLYEDLLVRLGLCCHPTKGAPDPDEGFTRMHAYFIYK